MKTIMHSDEYAKERQKILHSYFTDTIDILSELHTLKEIGQLFESLSFPVEDISKKLTSLTFDAY